MNDTAIQYFTAKLFAIVSILATLGGAIGLTTSGLLPAHVAGAGAWAIGVALGVRWVPMLKQAFPELATEGEA